MQGHEWLKKMCWLQQELAQRMQALNQQLSQLPSRSLQVQLQTGMHGFHG